jgi:hypothetical protein
MSNPINIKTITRRKLILKSPSEIDSLIREAMPLLYEEIKDYPYMSKINLLTEYIVNIEEKKN